MLWGEGGVYVGVFSFRFTYVQNSSSFIRPQFIITLIISSYPVYSVLKYNKQEFRPCQAWPDPTSQYRKFDIGYIQWLIICIINDRCGQSRPLGSDQSVPGSGQGRVRLWRWVSSCSRLNVNKVKIEKGKQTVL